MTAGNSHKKYCTSCNQGVMPTFNLCPKCGGRSFSKAPSVILPTATLATKSAFSLLSKVQSYSSVLCIAVLVASALGAIWIILPIVRQFSSPSLMRTSSLDVRLEKQWGVLVVPVRINDAIDLKFIVDSGASDVTIPADVVLTLLRTGTLSESDFLGSRDYTLADGSTVPSKIFRIRSLKVGNKVLENVTGSIAPVKGDLLLGQSFLSRFKSWHIDNTRGALVLE